MIGQTNGAVVPTLAIFNDGSGPALFASGNFSTINGIPVPGFAKWQNGQWTAQGTATFPRSGGEMVVFDDGSGPALYMLLSGNGLPQNLARERIARWNGLDWSSVGGGVSNPSGFVGALSMHVFDDGSGPGLYVGGGFSLAGSTPVRNIARWNGTTWSALGHGSGAYVEHMAVLDDGSSRSLFIGGDFINVGGGQSPDLARWIGCPNCYANCDGSSTLPRLTANDFVCFLNRYITRDPYANCTVDAEINAADFQCFIAAFAAGCP